MRQLVSEIGVDFQQKASGVAIASISEIEMTVAQSAKSDVFNLSYNFDDNFDDTDTVEGLYRPRFWIDNLPKIENLILNYELSTTEKHTAITGTLMPTVVQPTENFTKATYFTGSGTNVLQYLLLEFDATTSTETYDTADKDRADPLLNLEIERQSVPLLDLDHPNANSDHLWAFSQADIYVLWTVRQGGTTYTHRHLVGWTSDSSLSFNPAEETVEFLKGKPTARAVRFISALADEITGEMASCDPWFMNQAIHLFSAELNNNIRLTQKNVQRSIATYTWQFEWVTNTGHRVTVTIPKGQLFPTSEVTPGGDDISRMGFSITPIVTSTKQTWYMDISKSQVQRFEIPLKFSLTT
jgi:hypothetical protein